MTLDEAKAILGSAVQPDGSLYDGESYVHWTPDLDSATLDSAFTADELEAIAVWMRAHAVAEQPACLPMAARSLDVDTDLFTVSPAARFIGRSEGFVRSASSRGLIPTLRTASGIRIFHRSDLEKLKRNLEERDRARE